MSRAELLRAPWWLSIVVVALIVTLTDAGARAWHPHRTRFTTNFSPRALEEAVASARALDGPVLVLGDSVLWGYGVPAEATAAERLRRMQTRPLVNLSFQGGSSVNTYFLLRLLMERGVQPSLVIFNVNSKTFNPNDSAYHRLHPSLERDVAGGLGAHDRALLDTLPPDDLSARLGAAVESIWRLYAIRADIKQALFGAEDAGTALGNAIAERTGAAARERATHLPTPERFLGTYDLTPLAGGNVGLVYLRETRALLAARKIPYIALLTPTNHRLLADYIDAPEYRANLQTLRGAIVSAGGRVIDLDHAFPPSEFLDNDHLTPEGNERLAKILAAAIARPRP